MKQKNAESGGSDPVDPRIWRDRQIQKRQKQEDGTGKRQDFVRVVDKIVVIVKACRHAPQIDGCHRKTHQRQRYGKSRCLLLTKPFFGKKKNTSDLYSEMEIKLFLGLIQFSEDISWKEAELKRMLLFTRKYDSKKIKEQAEMSILKELASIQEEKGDAQKELEYIEQALTLVKESRTMRGLAELHFKKAGLLKELMQRNKDMQQKYQKQCQVELTMAYYTALVMDNVELVQKIKTTGDRV